MDTALTSLIAANVVFVAAHFVMSHPLRRGLVRVLGEKGFLGFYSLVVLAAFAWIIIAFRQVGPGGDMLWNGQSSLNWIIGSVLTVLALVFLFGSLKGNPALPPITVETVAHAKPTGLFAVTRHPMMWGFALWAIAHILVMPSPRTLATAGAILVLALVGAHFQDRKKEALLAEAWKGWEAKTSYWPRWGRLAEVRARVWIAALIGWMILTWAHIPLAYVPAGAWRWIG